MPCTKISGFFIRQGRTKSIVGAQALEDLGMPPSTYFKKLTGTDGIWEYRVQYGSNIYRIFCFFDTHSVVVLTHGLIKKTQKTLMQKIERAESYGKDFLSRRKKA
jgi:phage-related protein